MAPKRKAVAQVEVVRTSAGKRRKVTKDFLRSYRAGTLFTFGTNPFGALGFGEDVSEKFRPAEVSIDGKKAVQVSCGGMHTLVLAEDGSVYSFGVNDEGALGRKTQGSAWEKDGPSGKEDSAFPGRVRLPPEVVVTKVAAGDGFSFAITEDGCVYGWGVFKDDTSGVAAFSSTEGVCKLPKLVYEPTTSRDRVIDLCTGDRHVAALTIRGEVLTWGMGGQGQLGRVEPFANDERPDLSILLTPTPVSGVQQVAHGLVVGIACGSYTTFAITKQGSVIAWGLNASGQLGFAAEQFVWRPVVVESLHGVASLQGGEHHSLVITKKGQVLSFGSSTYGMLGRRDVDVTTANVSYPEPKVVDGGEGLDEEKPVSLAAKSNISACVTEEGNLWLWGSNVNYQLAKGDDDEDNVVPHRMRRTKVFGTRKVVQVSFGGQHAALIALDAEDAP